MYPGPQCDAQELAYEVVHLHSAELQITRRTEQTRRTRVQHEALLVLACAVAAIRAWQEKRQHALQRAVVVATRRGGILSASSSWGAIGFNGCGCGGSAGFSSRVCGGTTTSCTSQACHARVRDAEAEARCIVGGGLQLLGKLGKDLTIRPAVVVDAFTFQLHLERPLLAVIHGVGVAQPQPRGLLEVELVESLANHGALHPGMWVCQLSCRGRLGSVEL